MTIVSPAMTRLSFSIGILLSSWGGFAQADGPPAFETLFDGKTLERWQVRPNEHAADHWKAKEGEIVAENVNKKGSNLWTAESFSDYELELEFKATSQSYDTGVFLRGDGHQVQIGISSGLKRDMTGCLYASKEKHDGSGYPIHLEKVTEFNKPGQWNHMRIVVTGKRIQTFLNQERFLDYEALQLNEEGPIGLQLHPNIHMKAHFRNIHVKRRNDH